MKRQLVVVSDGGHVWIPDDEIETDLDELATKYWDKIDWDIEEIYIEEY